MKRHLLILLGSAALLAGCGGGSSSSSGGGGGGGGAVNPPVVVTVTPGQASSGINIAVVAPASTTPPNAQLLGVTTASHGTLQNTGALVTTFPSTVLLCGPGLSSNMNVTVPGMTVDAASIGSITCMATGQPNIPGVSFDVTAGSPGAHSVVLQNKGNNDITTFTGGLEVP